ncbi:MAG TPA: NCS2 family permease [bacterium]|nr:NCS2 family permease [bacterium]
MQKLIAFLRSPSSFLKSKPNLRLWLNWSGQRGLPWFVRGDLDGFFGLFMDNLLQLMLIGGLCGFFCGFSADFITGQILPGAALSILLGNLFYAWQARRLALQTGRADVTALPFGINTPSLIAFIFLIMAPVYRETKDWHLAWQAGLFACLLNGLMEIAGAFVGDWLRRNTPRAALLCALAGVAMTFISMGFIFQVFAHPLIGLVPMLLILISYASRVKWPLALPGGFFAVALGTVLAWVFHALNGAPMTVSTDPIHWSFNSPKPVPNDLFALLTSPTGWKYLAVILPMGLFNVVGSLQNLESAEAGGDRYPTKSSLLVNGLATVLAAFFGSAFPTTIYIGHPGWKSMGARHGYSILNGLVISLLCLVGGVTLLLKFIPQECMLGILLWIAIIITAQAFQEIPREHALAVAFGLIPAFAAFILELVVEPTLEAAGLPLASAVDKLNAAGLSIQGVIYLNQGFLLTSMIFAATLVYLIERKFLKAAQWLFAASALSLLGFIHAYHLTAEEGLQNKFGLVAAPEFAFVYALVGGLLVLLHYRAKLDGRPRKRKARKPVPPPPPKRSVGYL